MSGSSQSNIQNYDRGKIFDEVVELFQDRSDWHAFRSRAELAERFESGEVSWIHRGGRIVCAASYRHRRHSYTRVYFTAMSDDAWDEDAWAQMVKGILLESPHDRIISKTTQDGKESTLWSEVGHMVRFEDDLVVWEVVDTTAMDNLSEW